MSWSLADVPDLTGTTALVTGANSGLGYEISRALAGRGAHVVMACRNVDKAADAAARVNAHAGAGPGSASVMSLDLADLASVRALGTRVRDELPRLDLLANNAGLMAVDESRTADGFEMQFGVNHLGHFVLTAELAPLLVSAPGGRVVTMASMGHRAGRMDFDDVMFDRRRYQRWPAYFQSKLANLLFTLELHHRFRQAGVDTLAVAAHPGYAHTDLGHEGSGWLNRLIDPLGGLASQSAARGAEPFLRAATDPAVTSGEYYGPRLMAWGDAVLETPSARARDTDDARSLWALSESLTGTTFTVPRAA
ncbi:oxidoreductase [Rhabdothermincola salaria]|uniref:oxidoreductase n=1 Tax=Rhabdothermincola salaria TaxID=2903142 RepID=UPI001E2BB6B9|nr:oxidoreductase [Rhabdothermincola salaria]MCD9624018.1 oxidoreductase [Rhabdothermincola salaria]